MAYNNIPDYLVAAGAPHSSGLWNGLNDNIQGIHSESRAYAVKSSDQTVNNSTTLVDDDALYFEAAANTSWHVQIRGGMTTTTAADIKFNITTPSTPVGGAGYYVATPGRGTSDVLGGMDSTPVNTARTHVISLNASDSPFCIDALVHIGAVAGNVRLRWAQGTATAVDTKILAGSQLVALRVDELESGKTFTEILSTEVDAGSPYKTTMMTKLRDNPIALYNQRGYAEKASADSNATTTLVADSELRIAVEPSSTYAFSAFLSIDTVAAADLKIQVDTLTGAPASLGWAGWYDPDAAAGGGVGAISAEAVSTATVLLYAANVTANDVFLAGQITTDATASPTLCIKFAQNTVNATPTEINASSWLVCYKIDDVPASASYTVLADSSIDPESYLLDSPNQAEIIADNAVAAFNGSRQHAIKAIDESESGTTLQDDDDLSFAVLTGETWAFSFILNYSNTAGGGVAGMKYQITTPSGSDVGSTQNLDEIAFAAGSGPVRISDSGASANYALNTTITIGDTSGLFSMVDCSVWITGYITAVADGDVKLQFAKRNAATGNVIMHAGSSLYAHRLDDLE